jgi:hypothetical protein
MVWIRIQIRSGFSNSLDPDPDSATKAWIRIRMQQQPGSGILQQPESGFGFSNSMYLDPEFSNSLDPDPDSATAWIRIRDPERYL